jgi:hypothetical protein
MKGIMRWPLSGAVLLLLVAQTPTDDVNAAENVMTSCYIESATFYGAKSCEPPPKIVGDAFGSCENEETAFKNIVQRNHPNDPEFPDDALEKVRNDIITRLESAILNEQVEIRKCSK